MALVGRGDEDGVISRERPHGLVEPRCVERRGERVRGARQRTQHNEVRGERALVDDGTIEGGMLPKVEACLIAAAAGCRAAIVATSGLDAVERLLAGEQVGTVFEAAA